MGEDSAAEKLLSNAKEPVERTDRVSVVLAAATVVVLGWAGWLAFGPARARETPAIGAQIPPIRLLDAKSGEPLVLLGLKGRAVWLSFWEPGEGAGLRGLDGVWKRFKPRDRFVMIAAADGSPGRVQEAVSRAKVDLPVYVATRETLDAFGVSERTLPLHLLIDETGRVGAVARGAGPDVIDRLAEQMESWLDEIAPVTKSKFALARSR